MREVHDVALQVVVDNLDVSSFSGSDGVRQGPIWWC